MRRIGIISLLILAVSRLLHAQIDGFAGAPELHSSVKTNVTLEGITKNTNASHLQFSFYKDYISFAQEIKPIPVSDNRFGLKCFVEHPHIAELNVDGQKIPLFLAPDKKLEVIIDQDCTTQFNKDLAQENNFLLSFLQSFGSWSEEAILYDMRRSSPSEFRQRMDKIRLQKLAFVKEHPHYPSFDPVFRQHLRAEIDYWWAFYLLKYREIMRRESIPRYRAIEDNYYSFLRNIAISNDNAFTSPYYIHFIESYLRFRREESVEINAIKVGQNKLRTTQNTKMLDTPIVGKPTGDLLSGEVLYFKDSYWPEKITFSKKNLHPDLWLKVESELGNQGFIFAKHVEFISSSVESGQNTHQRYQSTVGKIEYYLRMLNKKVPVVDDPYKTPVTKAQTHLARGTEIKYSQVKTADPIPVQNKEGIHYDHFFKIKLNNNKVGWVPSHMVKIVERKVSAAGNTQFLSPLTSTSDVGKYLKGRAYYYMLARGLFWRMRTEPLESLGIDIANFKAENTDVEFEKIIRSANDLAQLRSKGDAKTLANYEYSVIKNILIQGNVLSPFEKKEQIAKQQVYDLPKIVAKTKEGRIQYQNRNASIKVFQDFILNQNPSKNSSGGAATFALLDDAFGEIQDGNQKIPFYLKKGMSLQVKGGAIPSFNGDLAEENAFYQSFKKTFSNRIKMLDRLLQTDGEACFQGNLELLRDQELYLTDRSQHLTNISFVELLKLETKGAFGSRLIKLLDEVQYNDLDINSETLKNIEQYLGGVIQFYEGQNFGPEYANFLIDYDTYLTDKLGAERAAERRKLYKKRAYYLLEANYLAIQCKQGKAAEMGADIKIFMEECPIAGYNQLLRDVYYDEIGFASGSTVPDFTLKDIHGKQWRLSDLRGKVVYLDFWATWCTPCLRSLSYAQKLVKEYEGKEVIFLFVSMDQDAGMWRDFLKNQPMQGVQLHYNTNGYQQIDEKFKVKNLPTYYLIDKNGTIPYAKTYSPGSPFLTEQIDKLLLTN